ncbi:hypothetical protein [Calditerricola satsumensis]
MQAHPAVLAAYLGEEVS